MPRATPHLLLAQSRPSPKFNQWLSFTQRGRILLNLSHQNQLRMLEVDRALEALSGENPTLARVVEMHCFGGMTAEVICCGRESGMPHERLPVHGSVPSIRNEVA